MKKITATLVLLLAAGVWFWRMAPGRSPTEADLRETTGIHAAVQASRMTPQGVTVSCQVRNDTPRTAAQVVLNVVLRDTRGQTVTANPLASVPGLAAGQMREVDFFLPVREPPAGSQAQVSVSLVRWKGR